MNFKYFSKNGEVLPIKDAVVSLNDIAYTYGYGVYETIRVYKGVPYFLEHHTDRLLRSAKVVGLEHQLISSGVINAVKSLLAFVEADTYNLKILLIGGEKSADSTLYILPLAPFFPDRKAQKTGVSLITIEYERMFPEAKTLNMLGSYLAYKKAKAAGCYDALLINKKREITEGTRTNFFCIKDKTLYSPPQNEILSGIMRKALGYVALRSGYKIEEKKIPLSEVSAYNGVFLTSTSSLIMPISKIDNTTLKIPAELSNLIKLFREFYDNCNGVL